MPYTLIGDCHGKIGQLLPILAKHSNDTVLQLGDMGLGFRGVYLPSLHKDFGFIRGNHDSPDLCRQHPNYAGEFGVWKDWFVIGGAYSIDWMHRVPGTSWWFNEELSTEQLELCLEQYKAAKPRFVASHEAPASIGQMLLDDGGFRIYKSGCMSSRTAQYLDRMLNHHAPELWFFGHYHRNWQVKLGDTTFVCLDELSTRTI